MATTAAVSVEEYLSNPRYALCEYLDGVIKEKYPIVEGVPLVANEHSFLVSLIITWFGQHREDWRVWPGTEAHTRIRGSQYRLPDVSVLPLGPLEKVQSTPPLIAIEVLSPAYSASELFEKLQDYEALGIPNIWVIDPKTRTGRTYISGELKLTSKFIVAATSIYLDLQELFGEFDAYQAVTE